MQNIRAGLIQEASQQSGDWAFIDPGFAGDGRRSCGLLVNDGMPTLHTFGELSEKVKALSSSSQAPLNLVIEAPLSVAFTPSGNPAGRSLELRNGKTRYWYVGLGSR